jgi:arylsulfatase A-like enzyme
MAEDPDVAYVVLAEVDTVQHVFGAADRPEEWTDRFRTPNALWDDANLYNPQANRDPVLDIVHEADFSFGMILDTLAARAALSRSFVVLMSDHSQVTQMKTALDVSAIVGSLGVAPADVERIISSGEQASIYLANPAVGPGLEAMLEAHEEIHPVTGQPARPFLVLNRAEMDSGFDAATGPLLEDGLGGNLRGEIYSQWSIDTPPPDIPRVRWPDLFLFNRLRFQNKLTRTDDLDGGLFGLVFNGHHGSPQANEITMAVAGPRILAGVYAAPATLADVLPTLYPLMGLSPPAHVDGQPLSGVVAPE